MASKKKGAKRKKGSMAVSLPEAPHTPPASPTENVPPAPPPATPDTIDETGEAVAGVLALKEATIAGESEAAPSADRRMGSDPGTLRGRQGSAQDGAAHEPRRLGPSSRPARPGGSPADAGRRARARARADPLGPHVGVAVHVLSRGGADHGLRPREHAQLGLTVQACGDAHLLNFGVFASPERTLLFDVNDFDETLPGPWEWDLKRLAASVVVAGRGGRLHEGAEPRRRARRRAFLSRVDEPLRGDGRPRRLLLEGGGARRSSTWRRRRAA